MLPRNPWMNWLVFPGVVTLVILVIGWSEADHPLVMTLTVAGGAGAMGLILRAAKMRLGPAVLASVWMPATMTLLGLYSPLGLFRADGYATDWAYARDYPWAAAFALHVAVLSTCAAVGWLWAKYQPDE